MREKCGAFLKNLSLCFTALLFSLGALADGKSAQESAYLAPDGIVEAEQYSSEMLTQIQEKAREQQIDLKDYVLVIMHEGDHVPSEVDWMIGRFKRAGMNVKVLRKKPGSTEQIAKNIEIEKEKAADDLLFKLKYDAANDPELQKITDRYPVSKQLALSLIQRLTLHMKGFFGLHQGASFAMFQDTVNGIKRPVEEKTAEVLGSLPVAALVGGLTWYTLHQQILQTPDLLPIAAAVAAAMFQVVTAYFDRAFNAFQVQGKDYFADRKTIETKRKWFYLCAYSHTFFTSLAVQATGHAGLTLALFGHTAWTSMIALFAKVLPKMWIARNQNSGGEISDTITLQHSAWRTISLNIGFSAIYESLKYSHLLHIHPIFSAAFLGMGAFGLIYEGYQHFFGHKKPENLDDVKDLIEKRFKKDFRYLLSVFGLRKATQCETLLMMRPMRLEEISNPAANGIL